MAVTTGDTFVIPIRVEDLSAPALSKISSAASAATKSFSRIGASVIALNQGFALMGQIIAQTSRIFDATIGSSKDLQKNIAEITTLLDDSTGAASHFTDAILELQSKYGSSQTDLAKSFYQAISSGAVNAQTSVLLLDNAQKLAVGGITTLTVAVDGLTTILNAYGLSTESVSKVSDALFIGMRAGKTTVGELAGSLGVVASFASTTGASFQELIAAISAITTGGVNTSEAVTQVRSAMVGLAKQTADLQSVLKRLGISSVQEAVRQKGLVNVLRMIISETDGSTEALTNLFGRVEAVNAIVALTSRTIGGKFDSIMTEMGKSAENAGKVTEDAFAKMAATTDFKLKALSGKIKAIFTSQALLSFLDPVIDKLSQFADVLIRIKDGAANVDFSKLTSDLARFASAIALLGLPALVSSLKVFGTALGTVAASAAMTASAFISIGLLIDVFIRNLKPLGLLFERLLPKIKIFFQSIILGAAGASVAVSSLLNKVGIVSDDAVSKNIKHLEETRNAIAELQSEVDVLTSEYEKAMNDVDWGIAASIFEEGGKFLDGFNKKLDVTVGKAEQLSSIGPMPEASSIERTGIEGKVPELFTEQQIADAGASVGSVMGEAAAGSVSSLASSMSSLASGPMAVAGVAMMFIDAAKAILDIVPNLLNGIADVADMITDLPAKIMGALARFPEVIKRFFSEFLSGVVDMMSMVLDLIVDIPASIYEGLETLIEMLPEIGGKIAENFVKMNPVIIAIKLVSMIIRMIPRIIKALVKAIPEIAVEFVSAFVDAIKETINELASALGFGKPFKIDLSEAEAALSSMGEKISKASSEVFKVMDLEAAGRGLDVADRIRNAIDSSMSRAKNIFGQIESMLKSAWMWVWEKIILPIADLLKSAWMWVWEKIILPIAGILKQAWIWVLEKIINPLIDGIKAAFSWINEKIIQPFMTILKAVWDGAVSALSGVFDFLKTIWDSAVSGLSSLTEGLKNLLASIPQIFLNAVESLKNVFSDIGSGISTALSSSVDFFSNMKFPSIPVPDWLDRLKIQTPDWLGRLSTGGFTVPSTSSIGAKISDSYKRSDAGKVITGAARSIGLATGGMAFPEGKWLNGRLYAQTGAIAQGSDIVPAALTPGEFVVNREATRSNLGLLSFINSSKGAVAPVQSPVNISIVINAKTDLNAEQIRREVVPAIERELKMKSQRGAFVLASSGLRS